MAAFAIMLAAMGLLVGTAGQGWSAPLATGPEQIDRMEEGVRDRDDTVPEDTAAFEVDPIIVAGDLVPLAVRATEEQPTDAGDGGPVNANVDDDSGQSALVVRPLRLPEWIMAGAAVATAGISLFALIYLRGTLLETRRTLEAASEANEIARSTAFIQQRPWVFVESVGVEIVSAEPPNAHLTMPWVKAVFRNHGPGVARRFHSEVWAEVLPTPFVARTPPPIKEVPMRPVADIPPSGEAKESTAFIERGGSGSALISVAFAYGLQDGSRVSELEWWLCITLGEKWIVRRALPVDFADGRLPGGSGSVGEEAG